MSIVRSVVDFIREITVRKPGIGRFFVYRGHASADRYKLIPSVFRDAKIEKNERDILHEMIALHPDEFSGDVATLEKLVRMQHFSLPTRLLDLTYNPLVALYFSCREQEGEDGEVIRLKIKDSNVKYFDSDAVSCVANLSNISHSGKRELRRIAGKDELNNHPQAKRLLHFIRGEKPYFLPEIEPKDLKKIIFVLVKSNNKRIIAQQGGVSFVWHD